MNRNSSFCSDYTYFLGIYILYDVDMAVGDYPHILEGESNDVCSFYPFFDSCKNYRQKLVSIKSSIGRYQIIKDK